MVETLKQKKKEKKIRRWMYATVLEGGNEMVKPDSLDLGGEWPHVGGIPGRLFFFSAVCVLTTGPPFSPPLLYFSPFRLIFIFHRFRPNVQQGGGK